MARVIFTFTGALPISDKDEMANFIEGMALYANDLKAASPEGSLRLSARVIKKDGRVIDLNDIVQHGQ